MKFYTILITLFILFSCSSKQENINSIILFNDYIFKLKEGEKEIGFTPKAKSNYLQLIENKAIQIPLFKCIQASNHSFYIGVPVNTTIKEMVNSPLFDDFQKTKTDTNSYVYRKFKFENNFISEYTADIHDNIVYILAVSPSKNISDSLFNYNELSNRLHLQKDD